MIKLPTIEETNAQYMMQNPQYSYTIDPATNPKTGVASTSLPKKEVSSMSTDGAKSTLNTAVDAHTKDLTAIQTSTPTVPTNPTVQAPLSADTLNLLKSNGAITADEFNASGFNKADYNFDASANVYLPKSGQNVQQTNLNKQYEEDKRYIESSFATQIQGMDTATQNLINSIQGIYSARIAEQQDANKRELAAFDTMNTRYGTTRYAPGVAQGVLTADERVGLDRIKKIALEEANLMATANQNLTDKKYSAFVQQRNELNDLRKEKMTQLQKIQDLAIKKQEEQTKTRIQSTRDAAIADLVSQGITDPSEIMVTLNESAKASGYDSGDFTADEIGKALKIFKPDDSLAGLNADYRTYSYLQKIGDPSVKGLTYFQFQAAISNAQRKPETPEGDKPINLSSDKKTRLLGSGLSETDINNIEKDVRVNGLDEVLKGITDTAQKKALREVYGQEEKLTKDQITSLVTPKMAYDGLKDTYTTDELKDLADEYGVSSMWTGADKDVERFLNSSDGKKLYTEILFKQYEDAGMTADEKKKYRQPNE